jgi:hypothetical protein
VNDWTALDRFLHTDPHDVGCEQAVELPHVYVDLLAADIAAAERYPGVAAHLAASGRARRTSPGCSPRWSGRPTDRRPVDGITERGNA